MPVRAHPRNGCTFPAFTHFFLAFRFWKHTAGTMVISSHLCSFKFVLAWLYFAKQASLFYNRNGFLLVICHLQAAWILPQVTDEGVNPYHGVRPGAGLQSLSGLCLQLQCQPTSLTHSISCVYFVLLQAYV